MNNNLTMDEINAMIEKINSDNSASSDVKEILLAGLIERKKELAAQPRALDKEQIKSVAKAANPDRYYIKTYDDGHKEATVEIDLALLERDGRWTSDEKEQYVGIKLKGETEYTPLKTSLIPSGSTISITPKFKYEGDELKVKWELKLINRKSVIDTETNKTAEGAPSIIVYDVGEFDSLNDVFQMITYANNATRFEIRNPELLDEHQARIALACHLGNSGSFRKNMSIDIDVNTTSEMPRPCYQGFLVGDYQTAQGSYRVKYASPENHDNNQVWTLNYGSDICKCLQIAFENALKVAGAANIYWLNNINKYQLIEQYKKLTAQPEIFNMIDCSDMLGYFVTLEGGQVKMHKNITMEDTKTALDWSTVSNLDHKSRIYEPGNDANVSNTFIVEHRKTLLDRIADKLGITVEELLDDLPPADKNSFEHNRWKIEHMEAKKAAEQNAPTTPKKPKR